MTEHWTPGPWRWEYKPKSHEVGLYGGRPQFDLTVMDFVRWGLNGAKPRFLRPLSGSTSMILESVERFTEVIPGREHHAHWIKTLNHPDANLIAQAPALVAALSALVADLDEFDIRPADDVMRQARAAIRGATHE